MDWFTVLLFIFFIFVLFFGAIYLVSLMKNNVDKQPNNYQINEGSPNQETKECENDSNEDSEGDGLMLFDDPMFPPEFDDEEDDL